MSPTSSVAARYIVPLLLAAFATSVSAQTDLGTMERQFRELPPEARRLTGPLFWLHGDESQERLES